MYFRNIHPTDDGSRGDRKYKGPAKIWKIYQSIPAGYHNIYMVIWKDQNKKVLTRDIYNIQSNLCKYIYINWITMTRKSSKHFHATDGILDSCFDHIRSHQQCILWSPPLEIEPATTESRAEKLLLGHPSTSHTSEAIGASGGVMVCKLG